MNKYITTILAALLLSASAVFGQSYEPVELAEKIFSKEEFPDIDNYVTGEYKGAFRGDIFEENAVFKYRLLEQTDKAAVVNMTVLDSTGKGVDTYLHFEKDNIWKMNAFRALAMTGYIQQMVIELEKMTPQQIEEIIEELKGKEHDMFESEEEYKLYIDNLKLILALDDEIIKHFQAHKPEFERLKNLALDELTSKNVQGEQAVKLLETGRKDYKKLLITSVSFGDYFVGRDCLSFLIGGMVDNTVGYLYVKDKKDLPEMHPSRIIMIREIGNGWYMYKTT